MKGFGGRLITMNKNELELITNIVSLGIESFVDTLNENGISYLSDKQIESILRGLKDQLEYSFQGDE
jgi:hypothetical protein